MRKVAKLFLFPFALCLSFTLFMSESALASSPSSNVPAGAQLAYQNWYGQGYRPYNIQQPYNVRGFRNCHWVIRSVPICRTYTRCVWSYGNYRCFYPQQCYVQPFRTWACGGSW